MRWGLFAPRPEGRAEAERLWFASSWGEGCGNAVAAVQIRERIEATPSRATSPANRRKRGLADMNIIDLPLSRSGHASGYTLKTRERAGGFRSDLVKRAGRP